jgi:hypothetical protein
VNLQLKENRLPSEKIGSQNVIVFGSKRWPVCTFVKFTSNFISLSSSIAVLLRLCQSTSICLLVSLVFLCIRTLFSSGSVVPGLEIGFRMQKISNNMMDSTLTSTYKQDCTIETLTTVHSKKIDTLPFQATTVNILIEWIMHFTLTVSHVNHSYFESSTRPCSHNHYLLNQ